jgi:hypothetical protein
LSSLEFPLVFSLTLRFHGITSHSLYLLYFSSNLPVPSQRPVANDSKLSTEDAVVARLYVMSSCGSHRSSELAVELREWFAVTRSTFYSWRRMKLQFTGWVLTPPNTDAWVFSLHLQAFPRIASCAWRLTVESKERECWIFCWMAVELREWFAVTRSTFYSWRRMKLQFTGWVRTDWLLRLQNRPLVPANTTRQEDISLLTPGLDNTRLFISLTAGAGTRCMSLLSSPPSLSSNSILCLAVDGR